MVHRVLFLIYVDDILVQLECSALNCHVAGRYIGALMYADDLVLISITVRDMIRQMIELYRSTVSALDLTFNVRKSGMIRIGPRFQHAISPIVINKDCLPL